jgi:CheY-like chemotaxis protein
MLTDENSHLECRRPPRSLTAHWLAPPAMDGEPQSGAGASPSPEDAGDAEATRRILIIDDNADIHNDFRQVLCSTPRHGDLDALEAELFGEESPAARPETHFVVDTALQGYEGYQKVLAALQRGQPYALAFVDMRMPPGWDGVETILHIIARDPLLEVVICSAYSDYSWHEVVHRVNRPGLRLLRKPFNPQDVLELAVTLSEKCLRSRRNEGQSP